MNIELREDQLDVLDQALDYLIGRHIERAEEPKLGPVDHLAHRISRGRLTEIRECLQAQRQ